MPPEITDEQFREFFTPKVRTELYENAAKYLAQEGKKVTFQLDNITAAGEEVDGLPSEWHAVLTVEGLRTWDHRRIEPNGLTWRQLPIAIFAQFDNAGHFGAPIVGKIESIGREAWNNNMNQIIAQGTFDLGSDAGQEAARMVKDQVLRWGSVDLEIGESELIEIGGGGDDWLDLLFNAETVTASGDYDWYDNITQARIMGFTLVATPAFPQAVIAPLDMALDVPDPSGEAPKVENGLLAGGMKIPVVPSLSAFSNPELEGPTPPTVDNDGRFYGHIALWDTPHIAYEGTNLTPPHSETQYAHFMTGGYVETKEGEQVRVGHITYDGPHANTTADWQSASRHYDNTCSVAADVVAGEDEFGIWFSGALRSTLSEEDVRVVRAHALSGDWRRIGGNLELVAALSVPVPGFPILASGERAPQRSLVAAGRRDNQQISLISAGLRPRDPMQEIVRQLAQLRESVKPLMKLAAAELSLAVHGEQKPKPILDSSAKLAELQKTVHGE